MKKKTQIGRRIRTLKQLNIVMTRHQWIYLGDRAYHPGWVQSWHYRLVVAYVKSGRLFEALGRDKQPYVSANDEVIW